MDAVFAFIDMLGFSEYVSADLVGAARVLESQRTTFNTRREDAQRYAEQGTAPSSLGEDHLVTSFDHFLPFSDSIFIASASPDRFMRQLATFFVAAFSLTGHTYAYPEDEARPEKVRHRVLGAGGLEGEEEQNWYPALWRGGLSFGRVELIGSEGIANGKRVDVPILVGRPVIDAVRLEKTSGKGPRLFCDKTLRNCLSEREVLSYLVPVAGKPCDEFLWPAFLFHDHERPLEELAQIHELLPSAINLWRAKRETEAAVHYLEFVRLIVRSGIKWAEIHGMGDAGREQLRRQIVAFRGEEIVSLVLD